jgi:hypothetical protein
MQGHHGWGGLRGGVAGGAEAAVGVELFAVEDHGGDFLGFDLRLGSGGCRLFRMEPVFEDVHGSEE